ncbi:MAG TPA: ATP synthase F1 subunit delta [Candidatus Lambdaproteobacteria bacterium]|uniref:ATP synthase subunit delta n=1 Tax=SAR324 cluster bacterium TaxID=2024889 RepID=A0A432GD35_9DELT|nr:ATP synthase F1 subunit delta [SAR324 cluster bacterium]RTZ81737.1 MAG: ATP synthase F1 subunit delta [SAR324 cluster bacterium]HHZ85852.1 ATP synthase F1 subunit delta [Candidatus Lambdaproteobacteria bacterium]HIB39995.1 ATP synthase F1 subunit delta [Candidatus Lambdaproteobacteria bacterium]
MSQGVIARRYAKALINLAEKDLENTGKSLTALADVFSNSAELSEVLSDTKVSSQIKQNVLKEILKKIKVSKLVDTFIRYLLAKRRIVLLPNIERAFNLFLQEKLGRIEAGITVAQEISEVTVGKLEKAISRYSGKEVTVNITIDPAIIGGIVTRIGSVVIDGSIHTQLNQIRQSIIRG